MRRLIYTLLFVAFSVTVKAQGKYIAHIDSTWSRGWAELGYVVDRTLRADTVWQYRDPLLNSLHVEIKRLTAKLDSVLRPVACHQTYYIETTSCGDIRWSYVGDMAYARIYQTPNGVGPIRRVKLEVRDE